MNTYEFIRKLIKLDPTGEMKIMLSVRTVKKGEDGNEVQYDACGFADSFSVEHVLDGEPEMLVIEAVDM